MNRQLKTYNGDTYNAFFNMKKREFSNGDYGKGNYNNEVSRSIIYFFIRNENV